MYYYCRWIADDLDIKRICKAFKKNFSCNGAVQADEDAGEVIQLSGDQRTNVKGTINSYSEIWMMYIDRVLSQTILYILSFVPY